MKTIALSEIVDLYKKVGADGENNESIRYDVNKGTLSNELNAYGHEHQLSERREYSIYSDCMCIRT